MSIKYSTLNFALLLLAASAILLGTLPASRSALAIADSDGVVKVESVYGFGETITRLEADIAKKGIMFFLAVDQSQLGADAGIKLKPSTLLIFGNPPLGIQFLTSNPIQASIGRCVCSSDRMTTGTFGPFILTSPG